MTKWVVMYIKKSSRRVDVYYSAGLCMRLLCVYHGPIPRSQSHKLTYIHAHTLYTHEYMYASVYPRQRAPTPVHAYAHKASRNILYAHTNTYTQAFTHAHTCSLTHCVTDIWMHKNTHPNAHTHCV